MFISFEGIDFCGKSTQAKLLADYLSGRNKIVKIIREPGGTVISEKVREILLDKKNNEMFMETELLLFSASRSQLVREKIQPFLDNGYFVISDRFHDSSTAYQGYGRGISVEAIMNIHKVAIDGTLPDLTFFIDIPVEIATKRKSSKSGDLDRIELTEGNFFEKVRNGYLELAKKEKRFRIINGNRSVETIHKDIINELMKFEKTELL